MKALIAVVSLVACSPSHAAPLARPPSPPGGPATSTLRASSHAPSASRSRSLVRAVRWLCEEQACEGGPEFAYDGLPAVSANGDHVAIVEERDGWGHTPAPGVRIVNATTGASERFLSLAVPSVDLRRDLSKKSVYEARIRAANEALSAYDLRPLWPADEHRGEPVDGAEGKPVRVVARVAGVRIEMRYGDRAVSTEKLLEVVVEHGGVTKRVAAGAWDAGGVCSHRAFRLSGLRPDVRVAVFVSEITSTTHGCDGVPEPQPWPVRVVRW